jgi:hypothetical protein
LTALIWEAYTDPKNFDMKHVEYVRKNACSDHVLPSGESVLESRPFWSELTEYDDEGFFRYCNHFILMNEMNVDPDEVESYLSELKLSIKD